MPRLVSLVPKYRKHRQSGQAIVTLNGRDHLLGPHNSKVSKAAYDRLIAEWLIRDRLPQVAADDGLTIAMLAERYWLYAEKRFTRNGKPTSEYYVVKVALAPLVRLYADLQAAEFGPIQLKAVRSVIAKGGHARTYINKQVVYLVRMFKWAVTEGLLPAAVHAALDLVDGLRRGETEARETDKVRPVEERVVETTLPHLSPTVRAMIELQRATGARPGEICIMRPCDIDRSGDVWEYTPTDHKTAHHDHDRVIYIGPKGQEVLTPFLLRAADSYCFSPLESADWHRRERFYNRVTPPNQGDSIGTNRKRNPKRTAGDRFTVDSYRRAIHRACDRAFPHPDMGGVKESELSPAQLAELREWQASHRWSPHQLRHAAATQVRKEFGIEAAKAVLGHSATNVTGIYAEVDRSRAVEVARKIG